MFNLLVFSFNQGFGSAFKLRIRIRNQAGKNDRQKLTLHPVPKNMKNLDFFLFLWVIFALLDPDPQFEFGSGSSNLN